MVAHRGTSTMKDYYKKVDKSFFKSGITIPKEYVSSLTYNVPVELGTSRKVELIWKGKEYEANLAHVNRTGGSDVYQIRWDNNKELLSSLKQEFIQSYFAIESQNFEAKEKQEYYITHLLGGSQEVIVFKPVNESTIKLETFIKIETPYDNIFKKLVEENVFGWLSNINFNNSFITKTTKWLDKSELPKHENVNYVVYYLIDDINKQIYIGSAIRLGDRVKPSRPEIPNWNKFRYEIIHPKYHEMLREIEYHSIMNFARFFRNNGNLSSINLSDYVLVNKDYKFYLK